MSEENRQQVEVQPAPYGRWPDGSPITQLEASAKQMDDWAGRHGLSGYVKMGIGTQHSDPERSHVVKLGPNPSIVEVPRPERVSYSPPMKDVPSPVLPIPPSPPPAPKVSWMRWLLNFFKGKNHG